MTDAEALAAARSIPHPRGRCVCAKCETLRDEQNNREAWATARQKAK